VTITSQAFCEHCGIPYYYQLTGWLPPEQEKVNNPKYCPSCQHAINMALKVIPVKFDWRWVDSQEHTVDELKVLHLQEDAAADLARKNGQIVVRRVFMPLIDSSDINNNNIVRQVKTEKGKFLVSYWTKDGDSSVQKWAYWDIDSNKESDTRPKD
jgi:hypothetical protein